VDRLFGQVSGFSEGDSAVFSEAQSFGINITNKECTEFIFVLNTVYAIYIKHIAVMILQSKRYGEYKFSQDIFNASLEEISKTIENGSMFIDLGIRNFMEGVFLEKVFFANLFLSYVENKKGDFALWLLTNDILLRFINIPTYVREGLEWLKQ
jgi:hypothetical protein